jgi:hypothetical protein
MADKKMSASCDEYLDACKTAHELLFPSFDMDSPNNALYAMYALSKAPELYNEEILCRLLSVEHITKTIKGNESISGLRALVRNETVQAYLPKTIEIELKAMQNLMVDRMPKPGEVSKNYPSKYFSDRIANLSEIIGMVGDDATKQNLAAKLGEIIVFNNALSSASSEINKGFEKIAQNAKAQGQEISQGQVIINN